MLNYLISCSKFSRAINPLLVGKVVKYFETDQQEITKSEVKIYAFLLILVLFLKTLYSHNIGFLFWQLRLKFYVAACSLLYRKSLGLGYETLDKITNGKLITLMNKDVHILSYAIINLHDVWIGIVQMFILAYIMYLHIGVSAVLGITILIILVPFQCLYFHIGAY